MLNDAVETGVSLDAPALEFAFRKKIERMLEGLRNNPLGVARIKEIEGALELAGSLPFHVNLWQAQNIFYELMQGVYQAALQKSDQGDKKAGEWLKHFQNLGARLYILIEKGKT